MLELTVNILKLLLAIGIGALVGYERERSGKPAGMRTLALVCMGSAFFIITSEKYFPNDSARVLAGLITGIGFLGAGAIIAYQGGIHGLTTAATIWAIAILGTSIGLGDYIAAVVFGLLIYLILVEPKIEKGIEGIEKKILKKDNKSK